MYLIKLYNDYSDKAGTIIHNPYVNDVKLSSGTINYVLGTIHDFKFSLNIKNPGWALIKPLRSIVEIFDIFENRTIFEGRVLQPKSKMDGSGYFSKEIVAESPLAYLVDSIQRHAEIHDTTIKEFLQIIIDNHNRQVESHKRFKLGRVTVTSSTDNVYRYLGYDNTYETIKDKLIDRLGGYIQARREEDGLYLDYLSEEDIGVYVESTPIKLAHNMQSVDYEIDPTEVITRLVPLGERIESEDEEATDASQARLTIKSVNDGVDYLDDLELQKEFGIIEKSMVWDNVTLPGRLKTNGINFLREQKAAISRFSVNAANSNLLAKDIASFEIGNSHDLINPLIGLDEKVQIIEKSININSPQKSSLKIGDKFKTLTQYQASMKTTKKEVIELKNAVHTQTKKVVELSKASKQAQEEIVRLQTVIENADVENLEQVLLDINNQLSGLYDNVGAIGQEVTRLQESVSVLSDFKTAQEQINFNQNEFNQNQLNINADVEARLQALENIEGDGLDG